MLKSLGIVLFLFSSLGHPSDFAAKSLLPDPPFPVVNERQVEIYHEALRFISPGVPDGEIVRKILSAHSDMTLVANELLSKGQERYDLPRHEGRIEWGSIGEIFGEAHPEFRIRLNLVIVLQNPELFRRSVVPHEVAHLLYFQKYGCEAREWRGNVDHDERWADIMANLVGFSDNGYSRYKESVEFSILLARRLSAAAGENSAMWLALNRLESMHADIRNNPAFRVFFIGSILAKSQK